MISLVMIVKDEAKFIERCLESVKPLIDNWLIVDTGSTDGTQDIIKKTMKHYKGKLHERPWVDFGHNRTEALALARERIDRPKKTIDWLLELDADMTAEFHPDLDYWLFNNPDPSVDAWMVEILDGITWRLPRLIRGDREWKYIGPVHEYLDTSKCITRPLLGLTLTHHGGNRHPIQKFDQYLTLLKPGLEAEDPRATFYSAECLRFLGCLPAAIDLYRKRADMNSFEEEAWYAAYQAAKLSRNVTDLLKVYERRPWRPEPLWAAADIVRDTEHSDVLFLEAR